MSLTQALRSGLVSVRSVSIALAAVAASSEGQVRPEIHPIETVTLTIRQALVGDKHGKPAVVAGELRIPASAANPVPAVILMPGGNGVTNSMGLWSDQLNSLGIAAFLLDSFSGRGIDPEKDQSEVTVLTMLVDAYRALGILAKNPRLDRHRIAIMGFSMGGGAAVYSATERFRHMYAPPGAEFAAYIGLYTPCYWRYRNDEKLTAKPVRLFHGTADDWSPIEPCRQYVARAKKAGADISLSEYTGAHHGYANMGIPNEVKWLPEAGSLAKCELVEGQNGVVMNVKSGKPFDIRGDSCMTKGAHAGRDDAAGAATLLAIKEFLKTTFAIK